ATDTLCDTVFVVLGDLPVAGVGGVADRAFRVDEIRADRVAAAEPGQIEESPHGRRPAIFVVGMTGILLIAASVIPARHLVNGAADTDITPRLVKTQV